MCLVVMEMNTRCMFRILKSRGPSVRGKVGSCSLFGVGRKNHPILPLAEHTNVTLINKHIQAHAHTHTHTFRWHLPRSHLHTLSQQSLESCTYSSALSKNPFIATFICKEQPHRFWGYNLKAGCKRAGYPGQIGRLIEWLIKFKQILCDFLSLYYHYCLPGKTWMFPW